MLDGVEIDVQPEEGGDKEKFTLLFKDLMADFSAEASTTKRQRLLLSVGIPSDKTFLDKYYDVLEISKCVDMVDLATYNFVDLSSNISSLNPQHHSPLYSKDVSSTKTIDFMCRYVAGKGVRKDKINVGLSFMGTKYYGNPQTKMYTLSTLTSNYPTTCEFVRFFTNNKHYILEPEKGLAVDYHAYSGFFMVRNFYDSPDTIREKVKYVKANGYGGVLLYQIFDDYASNSFKLGYNPLSQAVYEECSKN
ncbi:hypothetical protein Btru_041087 [Bulinus truncatus]|nr:hypothetical protein Btru_041087 [Bulinus truncatus]